MFEFHKNRKQYFNMQVNNAAQFVIPFIEQKIKIPQRNKVKVDKQVKVVKVAFFGS